MLLLSLAAILVLAIERESIVFYNGLINNKARGISKLAGALEKRVTTVEILNNGKKATDFYLVVIPSHLLEQHAFISSETESSSRLEVTEVQVTSDDTTWQEQAKGHRFYKIAFEKPLKPEQTTKVKITVGYINVLQPLPKEIKQTDDQFSNYVGSKYFFSPYLTAKESTRFSLASSNIRSFTKQGKYSVDGNKIKYGPFSDVKPFSQEKVGIHFQNNEPILRATSVIRDYEVSHWGNVRVSETYNLLNAGARLSGPYEAKSVYSFMYNERNPEPSAVRSLKAVLPPNARRVSYTDRIGNISTSNFRQGHRRSTLDIRFRYPLFGGWKTDFQIAYDAPAHDFLRVDKADPTLFVFNASFHGPFKKPVTELMTTKIALPEGAYDIRLELPYEVESTYRESRFTYLDSSVFGGRPVQVFTKQNVVDLHTKYFQVYYRYGTQRMYLKLVLMCTTLLILFLTYIVFNRIDVNLQRSKIQ